MDDTHWFDVWHRRLFRRASRQALLRATGGALASLLAGDLHLGWAKKPKKRKKGRKRKAQRKDQPKPDPAATCSGGACAAIWNSTSPEDTREREWCETVCQQCDGSDPREFCILGGTVADCCDVGLMCCDGLCVSRFDDDLHCGSCRNRCSPGKICVGGDCLCLDGLTLCGEICRDTDRDENHCGGCDDPCLGEGRRCCGGDCVDTRFDDRHCGTCDPCPVGRQCCHGRCIDPLTHRCCGPSFPPYTPTCPMPGVCCMLEGGTACCTSCCTLPDGTPACCG